MTVRESVFEIREHTWPSKYGDAARDAAVERIVETIRSCSFPWSRCIGTMSLRSGRFPFPIEFWEPLGGALGYVSTRRMWLMPASQGRPTYETIAHELAHVADIYSMSSRGLWHDVTEERQPIYDAANHNDRQDHPHDWRDGAWNQRLVEAVTVPFTRAFWTDRKFHYPDARFVWQGHTWDDIDLVKEAFLKGDRMVFNDEEQISEAHIPAVRWAAETGITTGDTQGNFNPREPVSREQMASFLQRLYSLVKES